MALTVLNRGCEKSKIPSGDRPTCFLVRRPKLCSGITMAGTCAQPRTWEDSFAKQALGAEENEAEPAAVLVGAGGCGGAPKRPPREVPH